MKFYFNFSGLQPILQRLLNYHVRNTDLSNTTSYVMQGHAASVLILLSEITKKNWELIAPYVPLITDLAARKWSAQCAGLTDYFVMPYLQFFLQKIDLFPCSVENYR